MKNLITYLKTLWSRVADSQRNDSRHDCRLTVGSPSGFNSKWMLKLVSVLVLILTIGSGNAWGESFTFTPTSASAGTLSGAPTGVTATFSNSYNSANQITKNNSQTLTLSGLDGCTITGVSVSVHNNKSSGVGSGSLTINGSNKGSLSGIFGLGNSSWTTKNFTVTSTEVATGGTVVVTISCSTNSVFCNLYTITYTPASGPTCSTNPTVGGSSNSSINVTGGTVSCTGITKGDCDIDEWGFVYGTATEPTGNAQKVSSGKSTSNVSSFNKALTGLDPNQKYYVRAYAKVGSSTFYGSETNFTTKTITASSSNTTYGTVSRNKMVITGSPKSGGQYASPAYTISGSTPANATTVSQVGNTFTVTSTSTTNITVTINFEAVPTYTVTWVAGSNSSFNSQTGTAGTALTNPGTPSAASYCPGGKVFVGWTETPIVGETNTVPADLFSSAEATSKTIPSGGTTYYAVFATEAASNSYTQITAEADLEAGKNYLIVGYASSTYKALPVDAASSLTTVSVSSSSISSPAAALIWTLEGSADAWKIKSTNNNKYLQISGGSLTFETSTSLTFSVGVSSSVFTFTSSASSGNKILSYYANGKCFNAYTKANTVYVYKQGVTRSAYATTCCTPWDDPTFSYNTYSLTAGGAHATKTITGTTHGTLSFESSNTGVITVNETTGEVTPVGAGTAHVIASWTAADGYCAKEMNSSDFTVTGNVTVTFKRNGGGGAADNQTQSVPYNEATALKTVATIGYTAPNSCKQFGGWATSEANATAGTVAYADGADITATGATTLWAIWTDITYAVSDGTMVGVGSHSYSANPITCGTTLTITCAADGDHKGDPTVTATGTHGAITVVSATSVTISNVTSAIAVSISYAEKTNVTATWNANNGSVTGGGTTTQKEGTTFTFPTVTSVDCGTFLGWTNAANSAYSSTSGTPTPFYTAGSTTTLNENTQFYAVYSKVSDDAVSATLYAHDGNVNSITNAGYTNTTVTATGISTTNTTNYKTKFDDVGDKVIFQLDGTPTSFSAAFQTPSSGTSGTSTIKLYESSSTSGPWTEITSTSITTSSTSATLSETSPAKFTQRIVKLEMTSKGYNMMCGDITIVGLRAPIVYSTNPGCVDWVLDAISVTTAPTKTTYNECEEFDPAGMVVTGSYYENGNPSNTTTKDVAGYTWSPEQFLTPGNTIPVTITYTEKAVTKTTTYNVRVNDLTNYTITFHDGGNTTTWTQSNHCDACNLDSRTGSLACGDYTFAGWSSSSTSYDDQSATITTWVTGSYVPTTNTDLYAVYRKGAAPPAFTANCEGGTFYIYEANGNTHMAGRVNNTPRAYTSEYWNDDCLSCEGDDGTPFTFTRIADNTYKIQNHDGEYLRKYYGGNHPDFESTWYNEDNFKWIISAGTNGTWRFTSKAATDYALVKSGNYFDFQLASNVTSGSTYYDLELSPAAATIYQSNPNCASTYTITFNTHGGTFVQGNYAYATETTSGLSGTTSSKFPSATLGGCTFAGWKDGSVQEEVTSSSAEGDLSDAPYGLIAADADLSVSSNKTYHAVYHYYDEDLEFDPVNGGTYHMYATVSGTKHFCSGTPGTSYGTLTSTTDCDGVVDVVITPGTGANAGKYKINIGGYDVTPELSGTGLKRGTFWWNIAEVSDNLYHITADGAESGRSLNYYSTSSAFTHYKDNGAGNTNDINFGRCRQHHWTSEPVLVPMVVLNSNSNIMVTSTNGQTLRSTTMLTVTATHYGETTKIYLSANVTGVGFVKSDGTALSSDAGGSYLQTDESGELATSVYVTYAPTVTTDGVENVTITACDGHSPSPLSQTTRSAQVRHLPTKFIIAQKVGDDWYALPNNMGNNYTSSTAAVKLSSVNESTGVATFYSDVTDQFAYQLLASKGLDKKGMVFSSPVKSDNVIKANTTSSTSTFGLYAQSGWTGANVQYYEFTPATDDLVDYTLKNTFQNNYLGITTGTWGIGSTNNVRFFSIDQQPAPTITWRNNMLSVDHATNKAENGVVTLPTGADPVSCNTTLFPTFCGWSATEPAGSYWSAEPSYITNGTVATENTTYYAVFKDATRNRWYTQCPTYYTLTFQAGTGIGSDYVTYTENTTYVMPDAATTGMSKEGYTLSGWTTTTAVTVGGSPVAAGGVIPVGATISGISGDMTFTAVWTGNISITGDVWLTSYNGVTVYATSTTNNLITVSSADATGATRFKIIYLDGNGDEVAKGSSRFRLCNNGSSNYNMVDVSSEYVSVSAGAYSQTYSISYTPNAHNTIHTGTLKLQLMHNTTVLSEATLVLHGRALPEEFVVASKFDGEWYALPNTLAATEAEAKAVAGVKITVDNTTTPTKAVYAPNTAVYRGEGRYAAGTNVYGIRLTDGTKHLQVSSTASVNNIWLSPTGSAAHQDWWLSSSNFGAYEVTIPSTGTKKMGMVGGNIGYFASPTAPSGQIYFLPIEHELVDNEAKVTEWGSKSVILDVDAQTASSAQARLGSGEPETVASFAQTLTSVKGSATKYNYTLSFSTLDFSTHKGELLYIDWLDAEDNVLSTSALTIPWIIASNSTMSTIDATKGHWNTEVHVLPDVTLTADGGSFGSSSVTIKQLEIYPGAIVKVTSGTLDVTDLVLRYGWTRAAEKSYDVAQMQIKRGDGGANLTTTRAYADWYIDYDQYYPISVPWTVTVANMSYKNSNSAASAGVKLRYYDGASRAENGQTGVDEGANWKEYSPLPEYLEPSKGYAMSAKRPSGKAFSIVRMPLTIPSASWTALGEQGEVSSEHKNQVSVTGYGYGSSEWFAMGWNFIGNPYMATFNGDDDGISGKLELQNGGSIRYATIPDLEFKNYYQVNIAEANLKPASGFFVQANNATPQTITFAANKIVAPSAPARYTKKEETVPDQEAYIRLSNDDDVKDQMGLIIGDNYTAEYEPNADLVKVLGEANALKTYMHYINMDMAYVAINETLAKEWIPVTVHIPSTGGYTFSLANSSVVEHLEGVYLMDYKYGMVTNLIGDTYSFHIDEGVTDNRFAINAVVGKRDTPTDMDNIQSDDGQRPTVMKFLYQDKMYILRNGVLYDATGKKVSEINK